MKETSNAWVFVTVILALLIGGVFGAMVFPTTVEKEVIVTETVQVDVPIETVTIIDETVDYLGDAITDFMDELLDEDDLVCRENNYDIDEVTVSKVYDEYTLAFDDDEYTVDFSVRLKFDEDGERSCRAVYDVTVAYEEGEDPDIDY